MSLDFVFLLNSSVVLAKSLSSRCEFLSGWYLKAISRYACLTFAIVSFAFIAMPRLILWYNVLSILMRRGRGVDCDWDVGGGFVDLDGSSGLDGLESHFCSNFGWDWNSSGVGVDGLESRLCSDLGSNWNSSLALALMDARRSSW